ncbi:MAG TPA: DUF4307 domain-containing protein [Actinocrinis sp.]|jgi:hypothetical protein
MTDAVDPTRPGGPDGPGGAARRSTTALPQQRAALDDATVQFLAERAEAAAQAIAQREAKSEPKKPPSRPQKKQEQHQPARNGAQPGGASAFDPDPISGLLRAETEFTAADAARYGAPRRGMSKARKITLALVGLGVLGGVAGYIGWEQANPAIQGTVLSYNITGNSVTATFEIDKGANQSATCVLAALDIKANIIGSATVDVPSGRAKNLMSYTLQATGTINTVEVESCTITG